MTSVSVPAVVGTSETAVWLPHKARDEGSYQDLEVQMVR